MTQIRQSDICVACNTELLPILVADGTGSKITTPETYCDEICEKLHKQYPRIFGKGYRDRYNEKYLSNFQ